MSNKTSKIKPIYDQQEQAQYKLKRCHMKRCEWRRSAMWLRLLREHPSAKTTLPGLAVRLETVHGAERQGQKMLLIISIGTLQGTAEISLKCLLPA